MSPRTIEDPPEAANLARRGRPPIGANRAAVLDATRAILAAEGYQHMTLEAVATRAGLYRRYINRTWRSKAELVRDALFEDVVAFRTPDTGSLEADLRELIAQHVDLTLRPEFLRGLPGLQGEFPTDPVLWQETLSRHVDPPIDAFATVLSRAVGRGEITGHRRPEIVLGTVTGAVQNLAQLGVLERDELVEHGVSLVIDAMVE
jgi:AcrR family transcriptional regulator